MFLASVNYETIRDIDKLVDVIIFCRLWKQEDNKISMYYVLYNNGRSPLKAVVLVMIWTTFYTDKPPLHHI